MWDSITVDGYLNDHKTFGFLLLILLLDLCVFVQDPKVYD